MSFHGMTLGITGTGKTYYNRQMALGFRKAGIGVLAHIPAGLSPWPEADRTIYDPDAFIRTVNASRRCAIFVELSDANVSKANTDFISLATWSRNLGHRCFFIAQRHTQISPTIRDQCGTLWLFKVGAKTASLLAEEWVDDGLLAAPTLTGYSYLMKGVDKPAVRVDVART